MISDRPRIGISACLLGQRVRYNGADKRDAVVLEALSDRVEWVPVCPEVEVGMGTPREPVQLVKKTGGIRMLTVDTRIDYTGAMNAWSVTRLDELEALPLSGYILKKDSPSCGKAAVPVFSPEGDAQDAGAGLFAQMLLLRFPSLPIEEEDALHDPRAVEDFLVRVHAYQQRHRPRP